MSGINISESVNQSVLFWDLRDVGSNSVMTKLCYRQITSSSFERQERWRKFPVFNLNILRRS